jgi:hypothetical protein
MKLETKAGVRTITLSHREQKTLTDARSVLADLSSVGEAAAGVALTDLQPVIDAFCPFCEQESAK